MGLDKNFLWHQKFKKLRKNNLYSFRFQIEMIQTILIKIKILAQAVRFDVKNNNKGLSYTNKRCLSLCRHKQFEPWTLLSDIFFFNSVFCRLHGWTFVKCHCLCPEMFPMVISICQCQRWILGRPWLTFCYGLHSDCFLHHVVWMRI